MDEQFHKMVEVNIKGRVFVTCQTYGVSDPGMVSYYNEVLEQGRDISAAARPTSGMACRRTQAVSR
ncbi:MAG: hypothetical protein P8101_18160 [Candidatus Thiodiazotropha sp.]